MDAVEIIGKILFMSFLNNVLYSFKGISFVLAHQKFLSFLLLLLFLVLALILLLLVVLVVVLLL